MAATINFDHIQRRYYQARDTSNPTGVLPVSPEIDFLAPHGREALASPSA